MNLAAARKHNVIEYHRRCIGAFEQGLPRRALCRRHDRDAARRARWERQLFNIAAAVADSEQPASRRCGKNDATVDHPDCPKWLRRFRQRLRRTARERDLAQLSRGKKADPAAVWRKERRTRVVCARYRARIGLIDSPDVQTARRM